MQKLILLFLLAVCLGCKKTPEAAQNDSKAIPVFAKQPVVKDVPIFIESIGLLKPIISVDIRSQVGGTLKEIFAKEGDWVEQNQPLFLIDPRPLQVKLDEANAQFNMDQISLNAAQKKLERYRHLARKDLVAQSEWDELEDQAAKAVALIDLDRARCEAAKIDLEQCSLLAPISGRMGKLELHQGRLVSPGDVLANISQLKTLSVEFNLTESELRSLPSREANIEVETICQKDSKAFCQKGQLVFYDHHFDPKTGQMLVKANVANPNLEFYPGQVVRIRLPVSVNPDAILIPQKAIRYNDQGPYVYFVLSDQTIALRQVLLGSELENEVVVIEGVEKSDLIVTDGHLRISPGAKVEVKS